MQRLLFNCGLLLSLYSSGQCSHDSLLINESINTEKLVFYCGNGFAVKILDKADKFLATAEKLQANNDEIEVLKAYLASARMSVAPQDRWQKYGGIVGKALQNATKLNPENPRATFLAGQGIFYTPEAFGGGKKKAEPILQEAMSKFAKFKPASSIAPNWGERAAKWMLSQI